MTAGETALPLGVAGHGVIAGGLIGGRIASHSRRLVLFTASALAGGIMAALVFVDLASPWAAVALAFGVGCTARVSTAVIPVILFEWAGNSRTTATGVFALSNQLGILSPLAQRWRLGENP